MYKAKASDVKRLQKWGLDDKVVAEMIDKGAQPDVRNIAQFWPSQANWAWQIGIYMHDDGSVYELLTRFGSVEGGRLLIQGVM